MSGDDDGQWLILEVMGGNGTSAEKAAVIGGLVVVVLILVCVCVIFFRKRQRRRAEDTERGEECEDWTATCGVSLPKNEFFEEDTLVLSERTILGVDGEAPTMMVPTMEAETLVMPKELGSEAPTMMVPTMEAETLIMPKELGSEAPTMMVPTMEAETLIMPKELGSEAPTMMVPTMEAETLVMPNELGSEAPTMMISDIESDVSTKIVEDKKEQVGEGIDVDFEELKAELTFHRIPVLETDFLLGDELGRGAFGMVYQAMDDDGTILAVKKMILNQVRQQDADAFVNELRCLAQLRHSNIVKLVSVTIPSDLSELCINTEMCTGGTLWDVLHREEKPLEWSRLLGFGHQIATAINYMHGEGIVHRDLKPGNIFLDGRRENVLIADFGLAIRDVPKEGVDMDCIAGTPAYMAPEVFRGGKAHKSADIFAFGVILWEMCTRQVPWSKMELEMIRERVSKGQLLDIPKQVPKPLKELIQQCMTFSEEKRKSLEEVIVSLSNLKAKFEK